MPQRLHCDQIRSPQLTVQASTTQPQGLRNLQKDDSRIIVRLRVCCSGWGKTLAKRAPAAPSMTPGDSRVASLRCGHSHFSLANISPGISHLRRLVLKPGFMPKSVAFMDRRMGSGRTEGLAASAIQA